MKAPFLFSLILLACLALLDVRPVRGQSLFGNRGPLGPGGASSLSASSSLFSQRVGTADSPNVRDTAGGADGFVGRGNSAGAFVGRGQSASTTGLGEAVRSAGGAARSIERAASAQPTSSTAARSPESSGSRTTSSAARVRRAIRPRDVVAFRFQPRSPRAIEQTLSAELAKLVTDRAGGRIEVHVADDGHVTLQGRVASEDMRRLAEALVRLEPGVRKVRNELASGRGQD